MTNPKTIDVLIPVYNGEATIESAVASIQRQTLTDIRIVIVNDGSTDGTRHLLDGIARLDPRITVINKENGGIVDALNVGLAACDAEFIARHDADDIAFEDRLEKQCSYLRQHDDCVAVGANVWHINMQGDRLGTKTRFGEIIADMDSIPSTEPYLMHPMLMVRREPVVRVGGYRYVIHAEDTDLYWRLREVGRLHNLTEILGEYRFHESSISSSSIVNGRIQAVSSQLAALSAKRRSRGQQDIDFSENLSASYKAAKTLASILELTSASLSTEERAYLEISTAAKLLHLNSYRPYSLERSDLSFIGTAFKQHAKHFRPPVLHTIEEHLRTQVLHLWANRDFPALIALSPPAYLVADLVRRRMRKAKRWLFNVASTNSKQN
ncbi:glycosyltransferase family 2 protein [Rhizobium mulingense]|uniref:glycosyltransferase family 2 protein n=1 Tax=Rhizobium mulingense TaxID=3031128 RepID=UPI002B4985DC|nr:glycosyltransferase family A protein [Rhizobium sp. MJ21]MEB3047738.1 glycosyltransferase family A protein [Rhizobium sp. MJ21]